MGKQHLATLDRKKISTKIGVTLKPLHHVITWVDVYKLMFFILVNLYLLYQ